MTEALKNDQEKIRMDLIPPDALFALAAVLTFGAKKYAAWNWIKGFDWSRPYGAAQRHLNAWWSGENNDPESGLPHLAHAMCCVMMLLVHERRGLGKDDRVRLQAVEPSTEYVTKLLGDGPIMRAVVRRTMDETRRDDFAGPSCAYDGYPGHGAG